MANIINFPSGKVGIGTENPQQTLDIAGTLRLSGSTGTGTTLMARNASGDVSAVTIGVGLNLSNNSLTATGGGTGTVSGSGTATQIAFWDGATGTTSSSLASSANLYWDNVNGRLGVGTNTPNSSLQVVGNIRASTEIITPQLYVTNVINSSSANNSKVDLTTFGTVISRNLADTNTVLNVRNINSGSTGAIQTWENSSSTIVARITSSGNMGIGAASPNARLQVHGADTSDSNWTVQFHNSLGNSNSLMIRNDGNVGIGTTGTTARLVVRASGSSSGSTTMLVENSGGTSMLTVREDGNVGVGLNNPAYKLDVLGRAVRLGESFTPSGTRTNNTDKIGELIAPSYSGLKDVIIYQTYNSLTSNSFRFGGGTSIYDSPTEIRFFTATAVNTVGLERMRITSSGTVGIGNITPAQTLDVAGTMRLTGSTGTGTTLMARNADGDVSAVTVGSGLNLSNNTLTATGGGTGTVSGSGTATQVAFWGGTTGSTSTALSGSSNLYWDGINNRLGIGTSTPAARLDVSGSDALINNRRIGLGVGNTATNTFLVANVGPNFTGNNTVAVGSMELLNLTTAVDNTLVGALAGNNLTTGGSNTYIGRSAGGSNLSETGNFAIGAFSLLNHTTGNFNVAIGFDAGRRISTDANMTNSENSIFIGRNTKPLANGNTNQIIIGQNSVGLGSNTTVIGNTGTTQTHLHGNLTLGSTSSPAARMVVVGSGSSDTGWTAQFHNVLGNSNSLMIRDDGNVGIGTSNPPAKFVVRASGSSSGSTTMLIQNSGGTTMLTVRENGNVGIGLDIPSNLLEIRGTTANNTASSFRIRNSTPTNIFEVRNDGVVFIGPSNLWYPYNDATGVATPVPNGKLMRVSYGASGPTENGYGLFISNAQITNRDYTTGDGGGMRLGEGYAPASGNGTYNVLMMTPTINQMGGASGITRGLFISPTITGTTAAADWRSIQWQNSVGYGLYGLGSAPNYLAGNLSIGTVGTSAKLVVRASGSSSGSTAILVENSGGTSMLMVRDNGNVGINTTTPAQTLHVAGTMRLTGSTGTGTTLMARNADGDVSAVTVGSGLNLSNNTLTATGGGSGTVSGSGTATQVAFWDNTTSLAGNSNLYWDNVNSRLGVGITTPTSNLDVVGSVEFQNPSTAFDGGVLGSELLTTGTGTNWTGTSFATGYLHATGSTVALVSSASISSGQFYQVVVTVSGRTTGSITFSIGGYTSSSISTNTTTTVGPKTTSTDAFTVTPTTDFNGTVIASVKVITNGTVTFVGKNSAGTTAYEERYYGQFTNMSLGAFSGTKITTGFNNTLLGYQAGIDVTTGNNNVFLGYRSGFKNTIGDANMFIGNSAGFENLSGRDNAFIGGSAGYGNTTGIYNVAIGSTSLRFNTTGSSNIAIGYSAGYFSTGSSNVFIGISSGNNTTSNNNLIIGTSAGLNNTTGGNNVILGTNAGRNVGTGSTNATIISNSIMIGLDSRPLGDNQSNQIVIGYEGRGLGSNTTVIGNTSTTQTHLHGNLTLGSTSSPAARMVVVGSGSSNTGWTAQFHNVLGNSNSLMIRDDGNVGFGTDAPTGKIDARSDSGFIAFFGVANGGTRLSVNSNGRVGLGLVGWIPTTDGGQNITTGAGGCFIGYDASGDLAYTNVASVTLGRPLNRLLNATTNTQRMVDIVGNFSPTSGNATFYDLGIIPIINQTGGASGITRGVFVNPTLTAAANWRSIEWTNNSGFGLYGSGTATNYLAGSLGIGTDAPAQTLHVAGTMRLTGSTGTGTTLMARNANGDVSAVTLGTGVVLSNNVISVALSPKAETPNGLVNGSNITYTLASTPIANQSVMVFLNGVAQYNGIDYTVSGTTITFGTAPANGSSIFAYYMA